MLGYAAHYGDPYAEQRALDWRRAWSTGPTGGCCGSPARTGCSWLHSLTTQHLDQLAPGGAAEALILSPNGHIEHHLTLTDDGTATWPHVEPGTAAGLLAFLESMRFMLRVEPPRTSATSMRCSPSWDPAPTARCQTTWPRPSTGRSVSTFSCPGTGSAAAAQLRDRGLALAGLDAYEALRIAAHRPAVRAGYRPPDDPARGGLDRDRRCTSARAATAARRRSPGCTTSATRRAAWSSCTWTAARTGCPRTATRWRSTRRGWVSSAQPRGTTSSGRSGSPWSSGRPVAAPLLAGGLPAAQEVVVPPDAGANVKVTLKRLRLGC